MVTLGVPPALTILQILAVDLGTDLVPALALGTQPAEPGVMSEPPRRPEQSILDRGLLLRAYGILGLVQGAAAMLSFALVWWTQGYGLEALRALTPGLLAGTAGPEAQLVWARSTTLALASIVACQIGNVFVCRSAGALWRNRLLWLGIGLEVLAILALTHLSWCQRLFQTAPLPGWAWLWLALWPPLMLVVPRLFRVTGPGRGSS
jgi:Ca2+-transporting ATPase